MDVFRFVKQSPRANDPTRRYQLVREVERDYVGNVQIQGTPEAAAVVLTLDCFPILSDAARDDALHNTRRFLEELVNGWGIGVGKVATESEWAEQPDGNFRVQLEYAIA